MEDESRPLVLVSPLPLGIPGIHDDAELPLPSVALHPKCHPSPPPIPCRPVLNVPPPGVFLTAEARSEFCMLDSLLNAHQADRPALPAVLPAMAAVATAQQRVHPRTPRHRTGGPATSLSESDSEGVVSSHPHALPAVRVMPERDAAPAQALPPPSSPAAAAAAAGLHTGEAVTAAHGEAEAAEPPAPQIAEIAGAEAAAAAAGVGEPPTSPAKQQQQQQSAASVQPTGRQTRSAAKRRRAGVGARGGVEAPTEALAPAGGVAAEPPSAALKGALGVSPGAPAAAAAVAAAPAGGAPAEVAPEGGEQPLDLAVEEEGAQEGGGAFMGVAEEEVGIEEGGEEAAVEAEGEEELDAMAEEEQAVAKGRMNISEAATAAVLRRMGKTSLQALLAEQAAKEAQGGQRPKGGKKKRGKKGQLADLLNPNSPLHHPQFAAAYKRAKEALERRGIKKQKKDALREHSKVVTRWSSLSAQDHQWFLEHRGKTLVGTEKERMQLLGEAVQQEQQEYYAAVQQAGQSHMERYSHCTPRQAGQIEADLQKRRERVLRLPRVYRLHSVLPIAVSSVVSSEGGDSTSAVPPQLVHVSTVRQEGSMPAFGALPAGSLLPGSHFYLPCTVEPPAAPAVPTASSTGQQAQQRGGLAVARAQQWQQGRPYRKVPPPELQDDSLLTQLLPAMLKFAGAGTTAGPGTRAGAGEAGEAGADSGAIPGDAPTASGAEAEVGPDAAAATGPAQGGGLVAMAASAFACLAGTPMRGNAPAWELPITVAPVAAGGGEQQAEQGGISGAQPGSANANVAGGGRPERLAVFVGKPLVSRHLSLRQKQARLHKYAVLSAALRCASDADAGALVGATEAGASAVGCSTEQIAAEQRMAEDQSVVQPAASATTNASTPEVTPRHVSYDAWSLGEFSLLVRTHDRALDGRGKEEAAAGPSEEKVPQPQQAQLGREEQQQGRERQQQRQAQHSPEQAVRAVAAGEGGRGGSGTRCVIPVVKAEYLPPPDEEDHTAQELASWWCKATLRPGCDLLVVRANVPQSKVVSTQHLAPSDLHSLGALGIGPALQFVHSVLGALCALPAGHFMLAHAPYEETCCLFKALGEDVLGGEAPALPPLPCSASVARPGALYDLHAAHARSGEADDQLESPFIPPRWRPFDPAVPQIPYTFPPRMSLGKLGVALPRKRQRSQLPYAWKVLGEGGDFDQVGHVGKISRQEYAQSLEEELA